MQPDGTYPMTAVALERDFGEDDCRIECAYIEYRNDDCICVTVQTAAKYPHPVSETYHGDPEKPITFTIAEELVGRRLESEFYFPEIGREWEVFIAGEIKYGVRYVFLKSDR